MKLRYNQIHNEKQQLYYGKHQIRENRMKKK